MSTWFHNISRSLSSLLLVAMLLCLPFSAIGQNSDLVPREYKVKAVFLHRFLQYTTWPSTPYLDSLDNYVIGVLGPNPFGDSFKSVVGRKPKRDDNKTLEVKFFNSVADISACHILYISSEDASLIRKATNKMVGSGTFIVGESESVLKNCGVAQFFIRNNHVKFMINLNAVKQEELKIDSEVLELAEIVRYACE